MQQELLQQELDAFMERLSNLAATRHNEEGVASIRERRVLRRVEAHLVHRREAEHAQQPARRVRRVLEHLGQVLLRHHREEAARVPLDARRASPA